MNVLLPPHNPREVIQAERADLNIQDATGNTALHIAIENGRWDAAKLLLANGARASLPNHKGITAYQLAQQKNPEFAKLIPFK